MPSGVSNQAAVNLPPRLRMATLYMVAQSLARGGRVANTCNRSEDYVGYSTKFGDSAGDFSPLANIMVHEVRQIGYELPIPRELVDKTPSDGLCGKTDEDNLGFTYTQLDNYIMHGSSGDEDIDKVIAKKHMQRTCTSSIRCLPIWHRRQRTDIHSVLRQVWLCRSYRKTEELQRSRWQCGCQKEISDS